MSRTRKTDRARAIHAPDIARKTGETDRKPKRHHSHVKLSGLLRGQVRVDDGGVRHGNNRGHFAAMKVLGRRAERHEANRLTVEDA